MGADLCECVYIWVAYNTYTIKDYSHGTTTNLFHVLKDFVPEFTIVIPHERKANVSVLFVVEVLFLFPGILKELPILPQRQQQQQQQQPQTDKVSLLNFHHHLSALNHRHHQASDAIRSAYKG